MSPDNSPLDHPNRKLTGSTTSADFQNFGLERNGSNGADFEWDSLCLGNMRKSKSDTFGLGYF